MSGPSQLLLEVEGLTKRYDSTIVLDNFRLDLQRGEVHALLGANGAGKSTAVQIVAGLTLPTQGEMRLQGVRYAPRNKREAESRGVGIVQQELNLIPTLSVAENLFLTRLPAILNVVRRAELHRQARSLLDRCGLQSISPEAPVATLGVGHQQMVEIAAALDQDCRVLILDEPTAALSVAEAEHLFGWLDRLRSKGVGIIYISHRLDEVKNIADRVSVLRDGREVGTFEAATLATAKMVALITGEVSGPDHTQQRQAGSLQATALRVEGFSGGQLHNISFEVKQGEKLGIAGLVGSGRTELLRMIFGADQARQGKVYVKNDEQPYRFRHPTDAVARGLAMVTEDRKRNGLLLPLSIRFNTTLTAMFGRFSRGGLVRHAEEIRETQKQCETLETRYTDVEQPTATLSGGNQQKVAISKWLVREADVFLLDEPTRGIDVAARRRIYKLLDSLAEKGKGLVVVSSDVEELMETCDRIAVMSNGRIVQTFDRSDWSHARIMQAAFSGYLKGNAAS